MPFVSSSEKRPVRILGISAHYHDSAAALVVDGRVVAAAQEERFTRVKGDASLPLHAIRYVLESSGVAPENLDAVAFYENPFAKLDRQLASHLTGSPRAMNGFVRSMRATMNEKLWVQSDLRKLLGRKVPMVIGDHHLSHAASAFLPSPFHSAATLTVDGVGEWSTTTIGRGAGGKVDLLEQIEFPNSLGLLYSAFTAYCGFRVNSGEYKLMGLAPYGQPIYQGRIEEQLIDLHEDGSFSMNPSYFKYFGGLQTYGRAFEQLFGERTRVPEDKLEQFHADMAASVQAVTTKALLGLARRAKAVTGERDIVLAGGVALNVVSVGELHRSGLFDNVWVQPAAGDAGGALGVALWASHEMFGVQREVEEGDSMSGAFLGPTPSQAGMPVDALVESYGLVAVTLDPAAMAQQVADAVAGGKVVGVARGRMEYGPRALGARSVLADARDPEMQRRLNLKTKFREGFRPFAPLVLAERASDIFEIDGESPYMLKTFAVRHDQRREIPADDAPDIYRRVQQVRSTVPAVTHVDHSARVQTVDRERNPFLHDVLTRFDAKTGCPVMVNTSFNVRGEPIVCSSEDALECFLATDIDALVLEDMYIERAGQSEEALKPRRASAVKGD
jgi:carbamoyltransferase